MKRRGEHDWSRVELDMPERDWWLAFGALVAGLAIGFVAGFIGGATW